MNSQLEYIWWIKLKKAISVNIGEADQGWVVQKPVNANPGLKVNQSITFSCRKMFFSAYVLCSLRLLNSKLKDKQHKQKTSPQSYKSQIKILANPGLP